MCYVVKPSADEELLFKHSPAAEQLRRMAKKLARERDRKAWWDKNKLKKLDA